MSEDESFDSFYGKLNGFLGFSRLSLAIGLRVEAPVVSFTQTIWWLSSQLLAGGISNLEKHLYKIFKFFHTGFWRLELATCLWLIIVAKNACFAHWGLFSELFSKTFHFSLASRDYSLSCSPLPLPKSMFSHTNTTFSSSFLHQSSRKGMGSVSFSMYFTFLALDFLDFVFVLRSENMMIEYGSLMFCWACCMGSVGYVFFHFSLGCTWCNLLRTNTLWHDWDLNVMF